MTREFIYQFIRQHRLAVLATTSATWQPEAAVIGIAVTANLEIVFDTVKTSRKYVNLLQNPFVALVIGWDNETTLQLEGIAIELISNDVEYKEVYFTAFPDGRERAENWPGLVHFKIIAKWLRYSNFNELAMIEKMRF